MPAPSAAAERLVAHWVADALAADETIDFSIIKALVGVSSDYLVGAPDAARERVALRCLQELATFAVADEGGGAAAAAAAAPPSGMLRVDAARCCEDFLVELTGKSACVSAYAIPNNRAYPSGSSNPAAPPGRRSKLCWTEEEEATLREAMEKFTPRDNGAIPWVQILEHGRNVFHWTRLPCDLRVKWRNMKKKAGS